MRKGALSAGFRHSPDVSSGWPGAWQWPQFASRQTRALTSTASPASPALHRGNPGWLPIPQAPQQQPPPPPAPPTVRPHSGCAAWARSGPLSCPARDGRPCTGWHRARARPTAHARSQRSNPLRPVPAAPHPRRYPAPAPRFTLPPECVCKSNRRLGSTSEYLNPVERGHALDPGVRCRFGQHPVQQDIGRLHRIEPIGPVSGLWPRRPCRPAQHHLVIRQLPLVHDVIASGCQHHLGPGLREVQRLLQRRFSLGARSRVKGVRPKRRRRPKREESPQFPALSILRCASTPSSQPSSISGTEDSSRSV